MSARAPLIASAAALFCFGLVALFNSPLTRNLEGAPAAASPGCLRPLSLTLLRVRS